MWHKRYKSVGIREKLGGKKQVVSFGGASCTKSKQNMKTVGYKVPKMLDDGLSNADAKKEGQRLCST